MRITIVLYLIFSTIAVGQTTLIELGNLPPEVSETSGLLFFNNLLITHNDSGGEPLLYEVDTLTREIKRAKILGLL